MQAIGVLFQLLAMLVYGYSVRRLRSLSATVLP